MNATPEHADAPPTPDVAELLLEAGKQYESYLQLARVASLAASVREELRSYHRTWKHPLGLVMNAGLESTSR
jgi:hypothetical protein